MRSVPDAYGQAPQPIIPGTELVIVPYAQAFSFNSTDAQRFITLCGKSPKRSFPCAGVLARMVFGRMEIALTVPSIATAMTDEANPKLARINRRA